MAKILVSGSVKCRIGAFLDHLNVMLNGEISVFVGKNMSPEDIESNYDCFSGVVVVRDVDPFVCIPGWIYVDVDVSRDVYELASDLCESLTRDFLREGGIAEDVIIPPGSGYMVVAVGDASYTKKDVRDGIEVFDYNKIKQDPYGVIESIGDVMGPVYKCMATIYQKFEGRKMVVYSVPVKLENTSHMVYMENFNWEVILDALN
jgi:hypothetical protein